MSYGVNAPLGLVPYSSITGGSWVDKFNQYIIESDAASIFVGDPVQWEKVVDDAGHIRVYQPSFTDGAPSTFSREPVLGGHASCTYYDATGKFQTTGAWIEGTAIYENTEVKALIADSPDNVYDMQVSTSIDAVDGEFVANPVFPSANANTVLQGSFGSNFAMNVGGGRNFNTVIIPGSGGATYNNNPQQGNALSGNSAFYLDVSTTSTAGESHDYSKITNTLPLKAIAYSPGNTNSIDNTGTQLALNATPFVNVLVFLNNAVYGHNVPGTTYL